MQEKDRADPSGMDEVFQACEEFTAVTQGMDVEVGYEPLDIAALPDDGVAFRTETSGDDGAAVVLTAMGRVGDLDFAVTSLQVETALGRMGTELREPVEPPEGDEEEFAEVVDKALEKIKK